MEADEINIPGINPEIAIELVDGDLDIYLAILQTCAENIPGTLDEIRNVNEETLASYAINLHGMKGIYASIGAQEASERAKKLELLAKAGNLQEVLAENGDFIKSIENLVDVINDWLKKR